MYGEGKTFFYDAGTTRQDFERDNAVHRDWLYQRWERDITLPKAAELPLQFSQDLQAVLTPFSEDPEKQDTLKDTLTELRYRAGLEPNLTAVPRWSVLSISKAENDNLDTAVLSACNQAVKEKKATSLADLGMAATYEMFTASVSSQEERKEAEAAHQAWLLQVWNARPVFDVIRHLMNKETINPEEWGSLLDRARNSENLPFAPDKLEPADQLKFSENCLMALMLDLGFTVEAEPETIAGVSSQFEPPAEVVTPPHTPRVVNPEDIIRFGSQPSEKGEVPVRAMAGQPFWLRAPRPTEPQPQSNQE